MARSAPRCGVMGDRITKLAGKTTRPWRLQVQGLPQAVHRDGRHRHGAQPDPAAASWVFASHLMASSKKGMSALQLPAPARHQLRNRLVPCSTVSAKPRTTRSRPPWWSRTRWSRLTKPMSAARPRTRSLSRGRRREECLLYSRWLSGAAKVQVVSMSPTSTAATLRPLMVKTCPAASRT